MVKIYENFCFDGVERGFLRGRGLILRGKPFFCKNLFPPYPHPKKLLYKAFHAL